MKISHYFLLLLLIFSSCVPQRKFVYVQSKDNKPVYEYFTESKKNIKIEPFDLLQITISSLDQSGYNVFSQGNITVGSNISDPTLSPNVYTVNDSGNVTLPIIGQIKLQNLTLNEATKVIEEIAKTSYNTPFVSLRFLNNSVTVLGEVRNPGTYTYAKEQLNIFRAIGFAGDITEYGNRKKVVIIREQGTMIKKYYLDLTSDEIFRSKYLYLKPNDVLYIQPLRIRRWGMKEFPFALIVSSITSAFLIYFYVKK